jgi:hypothetical protein
VESGAECAGPLIFVETLAEDCCIVFPAESEPD